MQHTIRMICHLIMATTKAGALHDAAAAIALLTTTDDATKFGQALFELQKQFKDKVGAEELCTVVACLQADDNGHKVPFFDVAAMDVVNDLLEIKVQEVETAQEVARFYTEDRSEYRWGNLHHLIDIKELNDFNHTQLAIHQFTSSGENQTVELKYNEVEELLAVCLRKRFADNKIRLEKKEAPQPSQGDDFDPFLNDDDLP